MSSAVYLVLEWHMGLSVVLMALPSNAYVFTSIVTFFPMVIILVVIWLVHNWKYCYSIQS